MKHDLKDIPVIIKDQSPLDLMPEDFDNLVLDQGLEVFMSSELEKSRVNQKQESHRE